MNNKNWEDIGYTFLVGEDGNIYEGRGWGKHGAHSIPYNSKSIGICMIGNFNSKFVVTPYVSSLLRNAKKLNRSTFPTNIY